MTSPSYMADLLRLKLGAVCDDIAKTNTNDELISELENLHLVLSQYEGFKDSKKLRKEITIDPNKKIEENKAQLVKKVQSISDSSEIIVTNTLKSSTSGPTAIAFAHSEAKAESKIEVGLLLQFEGQIEQYQKLNEEEKNSSNGIKLAKEIASLGVQLLKSGALKHLKDLLGF